MFTGVVEGISEFVGDGIVGGVYMGLGGMDR